MERSIEEMMARLDEYYQLIDRVNLEFYCTGGGIYSIEIVSFRFTQNQQLRLIERYRS